MEILFEKEYLKELFYDGVTTDKQHRYQPDIVKRYIRVVNILDSVEKPTDLLRRHLKRVQLPFAISLNCQTITNKQEEKHMGNLGYGAFPTHPGEVLKAEIEERGISQRKLAENMGLTYSVVNEILNARRPLTAKTALMFEAALDIPADSLMYLQTKYNLQTARKDSSLLNVLKEIKRVAAVL